MSTPVATSTPPLVAMGDPQAPFAHVLSILRRQGLLVERPRGPRLSPTRRLLSIGDHFDWGGRNALERAAVARDGEACLAWLASHAADQVVILAGNHDLARVGELFDVDDATFASLQDDADRHYYEEAGAAVEGDFFRRCAFLPSTEMVARDLSSFRSAQRALVLALLRRRRLRLAHAEGGMLFTHAGVTRKALCRLGLDEGASAEAIADALNRALDDAVDRCLRGRRKKPLHIPGLHRPADGIGEGDGILYHRPTWVGGDQWLEPRRFDPRRLPRGLWQVVGHVRDSRLVKSLREWSEPKQAANGVLRHMVVVDGQPAYRHGAPPPRAMVPPDAAVMVFIDGGMSACDVDRYELFDVTTGTALLPAATA